MADTRDRGKRRRKEMPGAKSELDEYKRAMDDMFQQLDWCIGYLHGIQKNKVAQALAQNRDYIAKQIDHDYAETDEPTEETDGEDE
jgi:hypothetical protein